jgi:hypothetical protein
MKYLLLLAVGVALAAIAFSQGCTTNYIDPTFQLKITDLSCTPNSGKIEVINQQGGVAPFAFKLVELNVTNSTGIFTGLTAGAYTIEVRDACGTVRTRQVTLVPYQFNFSYQVKRTSTCNDGEVTIDVSPFASSYTYVVVNAKNDTVRSSQPIIPVKLTNTMKIIVVNECGESVLKTWTPTKGFLPYIDQIQYNLQCDKLDLFPVFYGFDSPTICLYELETNNLIACKKAPAGNYSSGAATNFYNIPWGKYYIIAEDNCFRDSMYMPNMESFGGSQLDPYNWDCNSFTMHVDGLKDTVCLYDAITNKLISCKGQDTVSINPRTEKPWPSGAVWENLPYGSYYAWIYDPCMDSTFRIDSTVSYPFAIAASSWPHCDYKKTSIQIDFAYGSKSPYAASVYYPDGSLATTLSSNSTRINASFNGFPEGGLLKVIAQDACGNKDTAFVEQVSLRLFKSYSVEQKCPGLNGSSGSGDISITVDIVKAESILAIPEIIKMNGKDTAIHYSFSSEIDGKHKFLFPNLPTGLYGVKYSFNSCSDESFYDTIEVKDYIYPYQDELEILQCGGNPITFTTPTIGGLNPYTYQIIGSTPVSPSLVSPIQSNAVFTVGTGAAYQSIRVRTIDRCGNSALGNIDVKAIPTCDYVLPVDTSQKEPLTFHKTIKVYPNPSAGQFLISFNQRKRSDFTIEIVNTLGIKVYTRHLNDIDKKELVVNELINPGLYIISITDKKTGKQGTFKQIIQ